jgi:hypothetical protein
MESSCDPAILLLGLHPPELGTGVQINNKYTTFTAAPLTTAERRKQPNHPLDKQNVPNTDNEILFSHKKEWTKPGEGTRDYDFS